MRCCRCGQEVDLAKADIVELGYQCVDCSLRTTTPYAAATRPVADPAMEVYVPAGALIKPAGAAHNLDGSVTCVACGQSIALAQADIVGEGYRCAACSHRAEVARAHGQSDVGSHLSRRDRRELMGGGAANIGGVLLIVGGIVLLAATGGTAGWFLTLGGVVSLIGSAIRR